MGRRGCVYRIPFPSNFLLLLIQGLLFYVKALVKYFLLYKRDTHVYFHFLCITSHKIYHDFLYFSLNILRFNLVKNCIEMARELCDIGRVRLQTFAFVLKADNLSFQMIKFIQSSLRYYSHSDICCTSKKRASFRTRVHRK